MHRILLAFLVAAVGCDADPPVDRDAGDLPDRQEQLAQAVDARIEDALGERLSAIEMSLEQVQVRLDFVVEELESAQIQQDRLAAFEAEIKQALVDLGNVLRRAIPAQSVRPPDGRDPRDRRP